MGGGNLKAATKTRKELPDSVDWRDKGVISDVKDQGSCGSCWAFAATETIEAYAAINHPSNTLVELSAQQITSCTPNPLHCGGTGGCQGSICQLAYNYIQLFGHVTEADYPYHANSGNCKYDFANTQPAVAITGYESLTPNDQDAVMQHIAEVGPLAVAVYASGWSFYSGGIYSGCKYSSNIAINHAVQLVGYGSDSDGDYWIVRNSWGTWWGENGYIRLQRDATAQCGTDSSPSDGTLQRRTRRQQPACLRTVRNSLRYQLSSGGSRVCLALNTPSPTSSPPPPPPPPSPPPP